MTPTILETMKQALALWDEGKGLELGDLLRAAIKAMEDAKPVAWWNGKHIDARFSTKKDAPGIGVYGVPLYPAPAVPSQEPVAHMRKLDGLWYLDFPMCHVVLEDAESPVPLYMNT